MSEREKPTLKNKSIFVNPALERIINEQEGRRIYDLLSNEISGADLSSLLLHVFEERSDSMSVTKVRRQYEESAYVQPCDIGQKQFSQLENVLFDSIGGDFESIEFSPVAPFAINSALSLISQKNVLTAIKNMEVVSDPTTLLALESAIRRRNQRVGDINMCTNHRILRLQTYESGTGFTQHFKVFAMSSS